MSEKRFILAYEKGNEAIFEDNNHIFPKRMTNKEVEKMLNSLNEENKQLKEEIKQYWGYKNRKKQKIKDLEKQLNHIQNLIYKEKMQRDNDE